MPPRVDVCTHVQGGQGAAVIRGPIVSRVINQLIANTSWGELDYLVREHPHVPALSHRAPCSVTIN